MQEIIKKAIEVYGSDAQIELEAIRITVERMLARNK